ncbi:hypothetical protein TRICI_002089 [Trichomonascus ciferrii]|uniref:N-acetyl-D-glucosamine kinase n=1 Tax=Trichomonascus ciferrii TaxID=44093 RepID=A0A6A1LQ44_9ASCO|nr:hypothetical protein TRICI_002089 [Trichomonascus ciferrii]
MVKLVASIDGGGTKTRVFICNEHGEEVGFGQGGSSNVASVGVEGMLQSVKQAFEAARVQGEFVALWAGFAGIGSRTHEEALDALSGLFQIDRQHIILNNDASLLCSQLTFTTEPRAVGLIAGTGSIAMAFDGTCMLARAGGFGHMLGDEGSGYWIGLEGIKEVLRANQQAEISKATTTATSGESGDGWLGGWQVAVLDALGCAPGPSLHLELIHALDNFAPASKTRVASLSRHVFRGAYEDHEPSAAAITKRAAKHLAQVVEPLCTAQGGLIDPSTSALLMSGSLLLVDTFRNDVLQALPYAFKTVHVIPDTAATAAAAAAKKYLS